MRASNIGLAVWLLSETALSFWFVSTTHELVEQIFVGLVALRLARYVLQRRHPAAAQSGGAAWALVLVSVVLPFAFAAACPPGPEQLYASALRWIGIALFGWSVCSLRANFSVLPQARALAVGGPYRIVRHPMYAAYLVIDAAWWANHFVWPAFALWACEVVVLLRRAILEERCLRALPGYESYARQVEYRLCPGVF